MAAWNAGGELASFADIAFVVAAMDSSAVEHLDFVVMFEIGTEDAILNTIVLLGKHEAEIAGLEFCCLLVYHLCTPVLVGAAEFERFCLSLRE
jgi:hypothetical protein